MKWNGNLCQNDVIAASFESWEDRKWREFEI
jgi:hypothetical protein